MKSYSNSRFSTGSAMISEKLHIFVADKGFHRFLDKENVLSLNAVVYGDDIPCVKKAIEELENKTVTQAIFRMLCANNEPGWVFARFAKSEKDMFDDKAIELTITGLKDMESQLNVLEERIDSLLSYLDLMKSILISYDIKHDELKVFTSERVHTYFYVGTLDNYVKRLEVSENHTAIFDELVSNFKYGVSEFRVGINMKEPSLSSEYQWYDISGKTTTDGEGNDKVIAKIELCSHGNNSEAERIELGNAKDFGTGLANKATITNYAKSLLESKPDHNIAIAIIDLDNFKYVNDTFGHKFGDEVLAKTAAIIRDAVGDNGMAGRIGGDEMMVVLDKINGDAELRGFLRTIRANVEWSYKGIKDDLEISCSIGAAMYPIAGEDYNTLFEAADKLLYLAKEKGRNRYVMYVPEIHKSYLAGKTQTVMLDVDRIQYNKVGIVHELLEKLSEKADILTDPLLKKMARGFDLDDISFVSGKTCTRIAGFAYVDPVSLEHPYLEEEGYQDLFDENNVCVFDTITFVDRWSKTAYDVLSNLKVSATIQYRYVKNDEVIGYVFFSKSKFSKKWTEMDINLLAIIGKCLSQYLSMGDKKIF